MAAVTCGPAGSMRPSECGQLGVVRPNEDCRRRPRGHQDFGCRQVVRSSPIRIQRPKVGNRPRLAAQRPPATSSSRCRAHTGQDSTAGCTGSAQVDPALLEQCSTRQFPAAFDGGGPPVCAAELIMSVTLRAITRSPLTTGECLAFHPRAKNAVDDDFSPTEQTSQKHFSARRSRQCR